MKHQVGQGPEVKALITISKKIERLIAVLASAPPPPTPDLQQVTDVGNETTNSILTTNSVSALDSISSTLVASTMGPGLIQISNAQGADNYVLQTQVTPSSAVINAIKNTPATGMTLDLLAGVTDARIINFPDASGTVALQSDIPVVPSNIAFTNVDNNFSTDQTVNGTVIATAFEGDGSAITEVVHWQGEYAVATYEKDDLVRDGVWTMIANKQTTEAAAPVEVGRGFFIDDEQIWNTPTNPNTIITGTKINISPNYTVSLDTYRVYLPESSTDVNYIMAMIDRTGGGEVFIDDFIIPPGFGPNVWFTRSIVPVLFSPSSEIDIILRATATDSNLTDEVRYNYFNDDRNPGVGEISVNQTIPGKNAEYANYIRIHETDLDANNIDGSLIVAGSTIFMDALENSNNLQQWQTTGAGTQTGSWWEYPAELASSEGELIDGEEVRVTINLANALPVQHVEDPGGWSGVIFLGATFQGIKGTEIDALVTDTDIYGADIYGSRFAMPADWDVVATSGNTGSSITTPAPSQGLQSVTDIENFTTQPIKSQNIGDTVSVQLQTTTDVPAVQFRRDGFNGELKVVSLSGTTNWFLPSSGGTILVDAPNDGNTYARNNNNWVIVSSGIGEAPNDGQDYVRNNSTWVVATAAIAPSGLEAIDEGNGVGWRLIGTPAANVGNIGFHAIDMGEYYAPSTTEGALGTHSFIGNGDSNSIAPGNGTYGAYILGGGANSISGTNAVGAGALGNFNTITEGYGALAVGGYNTISQEISGFGFCAGNGNDLLDVGTSAIGIALYATARNQHAVGVANSIWGGSITANNRPIFTVGNGTINAPVGKWTANTRSDAFNVLYDGSVVAPSITNLLIDTVGAKSLVSREWVVSNTLADAPSDGNEYVRKDGAWAISTGGGGISDAPADGNEYARKDNAWVIVTAGAGDMLKSTYDTGDTGVVDDAEALGGNAPSFYGTASDVSTNAGNIATNATDIGNRVVANAAITPGTHTKITYDAKGLVTAGEDATTADIDPSTDRNYVTDAEQTVIGNTSGINTGDQDISGIATNASDIATLQTNNTGVNTGDQDISGIATNASDIATLQTNNTGVNTGDQDLSDRVSNSSDSFGSVPSVTQIVSLTQAEYDLLAPPNANTLYVIVG